MCGILVRMIFVIRSNGKYLESQWKHKQHVLDSDLLLSMSFISLKIFL